MYAPVERIPDTHNTLFKRHPFNQTLSISKLLIENKKESKFYNVPFQEIFDAKELLKEKATKKANEVLIDTLYNNRAIAQFPNSEHDPLHFKDMRAVLDFQTVVMDLGLIDTYFVTFFAQKHSMSC